MNFDEGMWCQLCHDAPIFTDCDVCSLEICRCCFWLHFHRDSLLDDPIKELRMEKIHMARVKLTVEIEGETVEEVYGLLNETAQARGETTATGEAPKPRAVRGARAATAAPATATTLTATPGGAATTTATSSTPPSVDFDKEVLPLVKAYAEKHGIPPTHALAVKHGAPSTDARAAAVPKENIPAYYAELKVLLGQATAAPATSADLV